MAEGFFDKVTGGEFGACLYGLAPPKQSLSEERIAQIAESQVQRIADLEVDGVVVYDIQDEPGRSAEPRPFPFLPTVDPRRYADDSLAALSVPKIVYRSVGQDTPEALERWLRELSEEPRGRATVLVGSPTSSTVSSLSLDQAYDLARERAPELLLGGIAIAERHARKLDEHRRLLRKVEKGCRFFITQAVYDSSASKSLISDYAYACQELGLRPAPLILTFSPCASERTLHFMKWLGISFPRWLENELRRSSDPLRASIRLCQSVFEDVLDFAQRYGVPVGINVESVSVRKAEIEASVELFKSLRSVLP